MSRNFELLRRMQKESVAFNPAVTISEPPDNEFARVQAPLVATTEARSEIARLVQKLFVLPGPDAARMAIFADVERSGAAASLCADAASVLRGQVEGTVCVADANFAAPSLHACFHLENDCGLAQSLAVGGAVESFGGYQLDGNLTAIPAGAVPENWEAVVSSDAMLARLSELRSRFDYVLVVAPPLAQSDSGLLLGQVADGLVLVLEAHKTRRRTALSVKQRCEEANVKLLGAILNNRTFPIPEAVYSRL